MKIIDLLNKIANGEEVPKKIKYDNIIYEYNEQYDYKNELQINYYSVDNGTDFFNNVFCYSLNDEVEILEEGKKIPEKLENYYDENLEEYVVETYIKGVKYQEIFNSKYDEMIISKLNEVLDYLKSK